MKHIQIHAIGKNGTRSVVNFLTGDNAEVQGAGDTPQGRAMHERLLVRATRMAGQWGPVLPDDRMEVVQVDPRTAAVKTKVSRR